jgi:hypothetical protein
MWYRPFMLPDGRLAKSAWDCYLWMSGQKRPPADKKYRHDNMAVRHGFVFFLSLHVGLQNGRQMGMSAAVIQATHTQVCK